MKRRIRPVPPSPPAVPGPGQESVWDYPRPPRLEACTRLIQVELGGVLLAESRRTLRALETSHPPVYYLPPADVRMDCLVPSERRSWCEWKGLAGYYHVVLPAPAGPVAAALSEHHGVAPAARRVENAAWYFSDPTLPYKEIRDYVAFYLYAMDSCRVDGEIAQAQPGDLYGGWITRDIVGPFKGDPGTSHW
jgi:uncharacterized protein (DUF427 family)